MAKATHLFLFFPLLYFISVGSLTSTINAQKTWCAAKPSTEQSVLMENINYACSHINCGIIQKGYACSLPDTVINHASVAMNLYYQNKGGNKWDCYFGNSGLITLTDPSYGSCTY